MGYSREVIKDAIEWDGSSSIDGTDPDWYFKILEEADPKLVASVQSEVDLKNEYMVAAARVSARPRAARRRSKQEILAEERRATNSLPFNFPW